MQNNSRVKFGRKVYPMLFRRNCEDNTLHKRMSSGCMKLIWYNVHVIKNRFKISNLNIPYDETQIKIQIQPKNLPYHARNWLISIIIFYIHFGIQKILQVYYIFTGSFILWSFSNTNLNNFLLHQLFLLLHFLNIKEGVIKKWLFAQHQYE